MGKLEIKLRPSQPPPPPQYPPANKPIESLTIHEKLFKICRHTPCSQAVPNSPQGVCDCVSWRPGKSSNNNGRYDSCVCGHRLSHHGGVEDEDFNQRLEIAMKIDKYLDEQGKLMDFSYEDEKVQALRGEMRSLVKVERRRKRPGDTEGSEGGELTKKVKPTESDREKIAEVEIDLPEGLPKDLEFRCITNDGSRLNLILLANLKNVFAAQLPNMPKHYIVRLTFDKNHRSIILVRPRNIGNEIPQIIGGITYRPFIGQKFAEIVFCAIDANEQVRGHGSRLMNYFKDYIRATTDIQHFMTYADDLAVGFFKKNGFTTEIDLDPAVWQHYIKDYTGGTLMQCSMLPKIKYVRIKSILEAQRKAIEEKLGERYRQATVYRGLDCFEKGVKEINPMDVSGIPESGWTAEMEGRAKQTKHLPHYPVMVTVLAALKNHKCAWPFQEPVNPEVVTDYYHIIKNPMDLKTLQQNMENDKYPAIEEFTKDVQKIFDNCKQYNAPLTVYVKCAEELEDFFYNKLYEEGVRL